MTEASICRPLKADGDGPATEVTQHLNFSTR